MQLPHSFTSILAVVVLAPLVLWRVVVRFRRASGRQRFSRYRAPVTLTIHGLLLLAVAWVNRAQTASLAALAGMAVAGGGLGWLALKRTKFEPSAQGLFYTPHAPIGVSLALLFLARLVYRLWEVYAFQPAMARSATEFAQSMLTVASFGLLAGHQLWYTWGLARWRHRVLKAKRLRELARREQART